MDGGPLEGVLVVALEQAVAAPFCTSRLADAGARVIKIERSSGDLARKYDGVAHGESAYFVWLNRGKQSLALDIKEPEDAALLKVILRKADVFVQNLAPGAAERAGFGAEALQRENSRLIVCEITGYVTGGPESPGRVGVSVADIGCGMNAHAAILQALYSRERTGKGCRISVSLFDGLADWMAVPLIHREYTGREPKRLGLNHATIAPYGAYKTGDGAQFIIAIQTEPEWASLCRNVLDRPDMISDPRFCTNSLRVNNRAALDAAMADALARFDAKGMADALRRANIAFGRYNTVGEFAEHSQLRRSQVATPSGPVSIPSPPQVFDGKLVALGPVPAIGEHSETIRREFS
jgi:itaconate CoA-transferase